MNRAIPDSSGWRIPESVAAASFPWQLPDEHTRDDHARMIRYHLQYMATGGRGMSAQVLAELDEFYRQLRADDLVVDYHPAKGFTTRPRRNADGDLIVGANEHTHVIDEGWILLRYPPRLPHEEKEQK